MKTCRGKLFLMICLLLFCFTSCNNEKITATIDSEEDYTKVSTMGIQIKDEGIYFMDLERSCMMFYDYDLQDAIPICMNANCNHDTVDCSAYKENGYTSTFGCYRDYLYYIDVDDPELAIIRSKKDGSEPEIFAKLNEGQIYYGCDISKSLIFKDNILYISCCFCSFREGDDNDYGREKEVASACLISLDLENGFMDKYELFGESEDAEYVDLEGYADEQIFFWYEQIFYQYDLKGHVLKTICNASQNDFMYMDMNIEKKKVYYVESNPSFHYVMEKDFDGMNETELFRLERPTEDWYISVSCWNDTIYYDHFCEATEESIYGKYNLIEGTLEKAEREECIYLPEEESDKWCYTFLDSSCGIYTKDTYEEKDWDKVQRYPLIK